MPLKLGFGFALVARFVKNINGQIRVRSTKGKGSIFSFHMPLELCSESSCLLQACSLFLTLEEKLLSYEELLVKPEIQSSKHSETLPSCGTGELSETVAKREDQSGAPYANLSAPASKERNVLNESLFMVTTDDNAVNLAILQRRLKRMGHEAKISRDRQECFDIFKEYLKSIDITLMDLNVSPYYLDHQLKN